MERLTFLNGDDTWCVDNENCFEEQSEHYCGPAIDRLAYYEDMEEKGRMRIFPCEVGDKAYWVNGGQIKECKVHRIQVNRKGMFLVLKSKVIHGAFNIGTIGHTVFFDREEAENALKGGAE